MYEVMIDNLNNPEYHRFDTLAEALRFARKVAIETANRLFAHYVCKDSSPSDGEWIISPDGKVEYV